MSLKKKNNVFLCGSSDRVGKRTGLDASGPNGLIFGQKAKPFAALGKIVFVPHFVRFSTFPRPALMAEAFTNKAHPQEPRGTMIIMVQQALLQTHRRQQFNMWARLESTARGQEILTKAFQPMGTGVRHALPARIWL